MTKTQTFLFPIPREVVLNSNQVKHHRVAAIMKKSLRDMGCALGLSTKQSRFSKYSVVVYVYPPSKRRLDPPNLYPTVKPLIDGLTDANLWEDDDHEHMTEMIFRYGGQSELPEVFIIKFEIKGVIEDATS